MRNDLLIAAESLLNILIGHATGSPGSDADYVRLRKQVLEATALGDLVPRTVQTCRSLG